MPDWGDDREKPSVGVARQSLQPTAEQRAAWEAMGREKFRDPEHQRFAQSHRSTESLREAGRQGYLVTAERYGREYAADILANHRREQPTRPEREMTALLTDLGKQEGRDYQREYKVLPGMYADFAIPDRKLAIEVHGGAHFAAFFEARGMPEREARRTETYAREGWTVQIVTDRDLREGRERTAQQLRGLLG